VHGDARGAVGQARDHAAVQAAHEVQVLRTHLEGELDLALAEPLQPHPHPRVEVRALDLGAHVCDLGVLLGVLGPHGDPA
jgi:hypothetical protein